MREEDESKWEASVRCVRIEIARRWCDIAELQKKMDSVKFEAQANEMEKSLKGFVEIHGSELAFPLAPKFETQMIQEQLVASDAHSSASSSSKSSRVSMVGHDFFFLQHRNHSVWTVLQAWDHRNMCERYVFFSDLFFIDIPGTHKIARFLFWFDSSMVN